MLGKRKLKLEREGEKKGEEKWFFFANFFLNSC